jgi:hypothetical protein
MPLRLRILALFLLISTNRPGWIFRLQHHHADTTDIVSA